MFWIISRLNDKYSLVSSPFANDNRMLHEIAYECVCNTDRQRAIGYARAWIPCKAINTATTIATVKKLCGLADNGLTS